MIDMTKCSVCSMTIDPYGLKRIRAAPKYPWKNTNNQWVLYTNQKIPKKGGVYFIFNKKGVVVYVGRTKNLKKRIADHVNESENGYSYIEAGQFDKVSWILTDEPHTQCYLEVFYLYHLNPEFNITKYQHKYHLNPRERHGWYELTSYEEKVMNQLKMKEYLQNVNLALSGDVR